MWMSTAAYAIRIFRSGPYNEAHFTRTPASAYHS